MVDDDSLNDLLDRWEEAQERGESINIEQLCVDHPDLIEAVRLRIAALRTIDHRMGTSTDTVTDEAEQLSFASRISSLAFHARGGLGAVYVGEDRELHRRVAVKFIHRNLARDPASRQRFELEAEVTGRLEHPGVVPLYGVGESDGNRLFYAMRFVDGSTLDEAIRRFFELERERPGGQIVEFRALLSSFVSVCKTIAYAHNRGIVHRDIKPENILLGRYGETLVVDWGLALPFLREERFRQSGEKTLLPSGGSGSGSSSSHGAGTPAYMSPEQASELAPTPAADVYCLGATLFKILTGVPPVSANTLSDIKTRILEGRIARPSSLRRNLPLPLEAICRKAMSLQPSDRYATALDLARDVERFLADEAVLAYTEPLSARLSRVGRRHRLATQVAVAGLALCLLVMGVSAIWLGSLAHREQNARETAESAGQFAERSRRENLRTSALFLAKSIAQEIELRWRILEAEAASPKLRELLLAANRGLVEKQLEKESLDPMDHTAIQTWLDKRYIANNAAVKTKAWNINAIEGTQVARVPEARSIGRNYRHRDYFHGRGKDLPRDSEEVRQATPLAGKIVHMSAVFESTNTGTLMVAFSVPIWSASVEEAQRQPIGILSMVVELGDFAIGRHAVLADTRVDQIASRRGLILHHPRLGLKTSDEALPRLSSAVVENAMLLRADRRRTVPLQTSPQTSILEQFDDPVDGQTHLAALEPVVIVGRPSNIADTGWIVIAEEAADSP
jgi:eukaryotic-like serine/threonine-protein kinase